MKQFKNLVALVLALVMVLSVASVALATSAGPANVYTTGSITVNNAVKGETYYAIKALSATASDDGIAYAGPIPTELASVLEIKTVGTAPNTYQAVGKIDGVSNDDYQAAMRAFATAQQANWGTGEECTGNSVTFSGLEMGFYVIVSTLTDSGETTLTNKVSAVSTYDSSAAAGSRNAGTIYEKNTTTVTVVKEAGTSYAIGDTVEYTVTFNGVNYIGEGDQAEIVVWMKVIDTLPEFLSDAVVTSVTVGGTEIISSLDVSKFDTDKYFYIPWADGSHAAGWTSKYANGVEIVITYHATLTDIVKVDGTAGNKNVVEIQPCTDNNGNPEPHEENWKDDKVIYTYAAALKKTDGTNLLAGAKFKFTGLTANPAPGYTKGVYVVEVLASSGEGTELEVGDDGMLYIIGLAEDDSLTGEETVAPAGYNKLTGTVTVTPEQTGVEIWHTAGTRKFDADGNVIAETSTASSTRQVTKTLSQLDATAVNVVNQAGTELPSTGGIGTTIIYVVGAVLVLGAAAVILARRKAEQQ